MTFEAAGKRTRIAAVRGRLNDALSRCGICPRRCLVDRTNGDRGYCRAGILPSIYSYGPHRGEEPPISGSMGSGTIFFSRCNMKCVYCQNCRFSQLDEGKEISVDDLAKIMLGLRDGGCHNINLVTPTHFIPQIVEALDIAYASGLDIPIVYNTSGYELTETLKELDGIVDIYLPDMRYASAGHAERYSDAPQYPSYNRPAVIEMHRQVGHLRTDAQGLAVQGLIIRLLALPGGLSGTEETLNFIARSIGTDTYISLMSQYYPAYKASSFREISSRITRGEYQKVVDVAAALGLNDGWIQPQPVETHESFLGTNMKPMTDLDA